MIDHFEKRSVTASFTIYIYIYIYIYMRKNNKDGIKQYFCADARVRVCVRLYAQKRCSVCQVHMVYVCI
jgi:hypothetical protein